MKQVLPAPSSPVKTQQLAAFEQRAEATPHALVSRAELVSITRMISSGPSVCFVHGTRYARFVDFHWRVSNAAGCSRGLLRESCDRTYSKPSFQGARVNRARQLVEQVADDVPYSAIAHRDPVGSVAMQENA